MGMSGFDPAKGGMTMVGAKLGDPGAVHRSSAVLSVTEELHSSFVTGILTKAEVTLGIGKKNRGGVL